MSDKKGINNFTRGDSRRYKMFVYRTDADGNKVPVSVDGGTLFFTIKKKVKDSDDQAVLRIEELQTDDDLDPTGVAAITMTNADSQAIDAGEYEYDFQFVAADGWVSTPLSTEYDGVDKLTVYHGVTERITP